MLTFSRISSDGVLVHRVRSQDPEYLRPLRRRRFVLLPLPLTLFTADLLRRLSHSQEPGPRSWTTSQSTPNRGEPKREEWTCRDSISPSRLSSIRSRSLKIDPSSFTREGGAAVALGLRMMPFLFFLARFYVLWYDESFSSCSKQRDASRISPHFLFLDLKRQASRTSFRLSRTGATLKSAS